MVIADQKHGFRCIDNSLSLTLLRSSYDPDPYPELGVHRFGFAVALAEGSSAAQLVAAAADRAHPLVPCRERCMRVAPSLAGFPHPGGRDRGGLRGQDARGRGRGVLVRLYETEGKKTRAALRFFCAPSAAWPWT